MSLEETIFKQQLTNYWRILLIAKNADYSSRLSSLILLQHHSKFLSLWNLDVTTIMAPYLQAHKACQQPAMNQGNNNGGKWGGARWNDMLLIKFPRVKPRLFHLYVFTYKIDLFSFCRIFTNSFPFARSRISTLFYSRSPTTFVYSPSRNSSSFSRARPRSILYVNTYKWKSLGLTQGNFINNMSFQRAQGKIDTFYPHCYSLGRWQPWWLLLLLTWRENTFALALVGFAISKSFTLSFVCPVQRWRDISAVSL